MGETDVKKLVKAAMDKFRASMGHLGGIKKATIKGGDDGPETVIVDKKERQGS